MTYFYGDAWRDFLCSFCTTTTSAEALACACPSQRTQSAPSKRRTSGDVFHRTSPAPVMADIVTVTYWTTGSGCVFDCTVDECVVEWCSGKFGTGGMLGSPSPSLLLPLDPIVFLCHFPKGLHNNQVDISHQFCEPPLPRPILDIQIFQNSLRNLPLRNPLSFSKRVNWQVSGRIGAPRSRKNFATHTHTHFGGDGGNANLSLFLLILVSFGGLPFPPPPEKYLRDGISLDYTTGVDQHHSCDMYCCGNLQRFFLADICRNQSWSDEPKKWLSKLLSFQVRVIVCAVSCATKQQQEAGVRYKFAL